MRVLVLGPNGQLGSDLFRAAEARPAGGPALELVPVSRASLDLEQPDRIPEVLGSMRFDALINCTGYHQTDEVESNAPRAVTLNAHAVARLAEVCADAQARLVQVSTDYVFDGLKRSPYREGDATRPLNVYGATKLMGEGLAAAGHSDTIVLRVASLFGVAGASGKGGNFVETMLRVGREKGELRVVNDITMSPTATADVACWILALLAKDAEPGIYHAVNSGTATWHEFAVEIIRRAGVHATVAAVPSSVYPTPAPRPAYSALDNGKLTRLVGEIPPWADALDRYLRAKGHVA